MPMGNSNRINPTDTSGSITYGKGGSYDSEVLRLKRIATELSTNYEKLNKQVKEGTLSIQELTAHLQENSKLFADLNLVQVTNILRDEIGFLREELAKQRADFEKRILSLEEQVSELKTRNLNLERKNENLEKKVGNQQIQIDNQKKKIDNQEKQILALTQDNANLRVEVLALKADNLRLNAANKKLEQDNAILHQKIDDMKADHSKEIADMKADHSKEIADMKADHSKEIDRKIAENNAIWEAKWGEREAKWEKERAEFKKERQDSEVKFQDTLNAMMNSVLDRMNKHTNEALCNALNISEEERKRLVDQIAQTKAENGALNAALNADALKKQLLAANGIEESSVYIKKDGDDKVGGTNASDVNLLFELEPSEGPASQVNKMIGALRKDKEQGMAVQNALIYAIKNEKGQVMYFSPDFKEKQKVIVNGIPTKPKLNFAETSLDMNEEMGEITVHTLGGLKLNPTKEYEIYETNLSVPMKDIPGQSVIMIVANLIAPNIFADSKELGRESKFYKNHPYFTEFGGRFVGSAVNAALFIGGVVIGKGIEDVLPGSEGVNSQFSSSYLRNQILPSSDKVPLLPDNNKGCNIS